jgi:hypothetical protein
MQILRASKIKLITVLLLAVFIALISGFSNSVNAQGFSGNDPNSYTCEGTKYPDSRPTYNARVKKIICGNDVNVNALPLPPTLRQAQVWFVSILYAMWGFAGITFTLSLMILGIQYMLSRGEPDKIKEVKKRIQRWAIGFVLVFLAYPILSTVFSFVGLNQCLTSGIEIPGFQFFFEQALDPGSC